MADPRFRFQAAIFDFDGTLVDSERHYAELLAKVMTTRGINADFDEVYEAYETYLGRSWKCIATMIERRWPGAFVDAEDLIASVDQELAAERGLFGDPISNSIDLLHRVAEICPVCIVTGSSRQHVIEAAGHLALDPAIKFILGCEDYAPGKPSPTPYLVAAERLQVPADSCVVFEDSSVGVQGAKAAGMACVQLISKTQSTATNHQADLVVDDLLCPSVWQFLGQP